MTRKANSYYNGEDIGMPARLKKPTTFDRNNPESMRDYADRMEAWLNEKESYDLRVSVYHASKAARRDELCKQLADENGINMSQASVLFNAALEDGHDEGINSAIDRFEHLVDIIERYNTAGNWI
jgi:hypothetical protein